MPPVVKILVLLVVGLFVPLALEMPMTLAIEHLTEPPAVALVVLGPCADCAVSN